MVVPGYGSLLEHTLTLAHLGAVLLWCHSAVPFLVTAFVLNSVMDCNTNGMFPMGT